MKKPPPETISREEFDLRLDSLNQQRNAELQQRDLEQIRIEELLARYEQTLDEIETAIEGKKEVPVYPVAIRKRLEELAARTAEMASLL
jgi:hypothetical protein